jgi:triacylglycerol lipase
VRPDLVASVTSVAGPNHGSELADYLEEHFPQSTLRGGWSMRHSSDDLGLAFFDTGYRGTRLPTDVDAAHHSLTTSGVARSTRCSRKALPETWGGQGEELVNGVRYYSWSGTCNRGARTAASNLFDTTNLTCRIFARTFTKERGQSDGMVGRFSSHLGTVIGDDFPLDHFDIVNQHLGLVGKGADPVGLFLDHAARLKAAGL